MSFDPFLKMMGNSNPTATRKGTKYLGEAVLIHLVDFGNLFDNTCLETF